MRDLPPLKSLRAFEACFHYNSFTKAAHSLNVGQPAISHQIRVLEADLGKRLFKKYGPQIEPTAEAKAYYANIQPALKAIAAASRELRSNGLPTGFHIGSYPGLATHWLAPRLAQLSQDHPNIDVRLITAESDRDLPLDSLDCAILFGDGTWAGFESIRLIDEEVIPVCSKVLFDKWHTATPRELIEKAPLIELADQENRWFNWHDWKAHKGIESPHNCALTVFNHALALHQCVMGQGVTLAWRAVVTDMLRAGTLYELPMAALSSDRGYYLVAKSDFLSEKFGQILVEFLT